MSNPGMLPRMRPRQQNRAFGRRAASPATAPIFIHYRQRHRSAATWGGGEAVIRLQPGPVFSGSTADYWAPLTGWRSIPATLIWAALGQ